jgi:hypothetical protein
MTSHYNDPGYWRDRAEELRAIAADLKEDSAREAILKCAEDYDVLAQRAERRLKTGNSN